jgi:hypothetical protein
MVAIRELEYLGHRGGELIDAQARMVVLYPIGRSWSGAARAEVAHGRAAGQPRTFGGERR